MVAKKAWSPRRANSPKRFSLSLTGSFISAKHNSTPPACKVSSSSESAVPRRYALHVRAKRLETSAKELRQLIDEGKSLFGEGIDDAIARGVLQIVAESDDER